MEKGLKNHKRNTVAMKNQLCNQTYKVYIKTDLLGLYQGRFSLIQLNLFLCSGQLGPLYSRSNSF